MEAYEEAKLRMQCVEVARTVAIATASAYGILDEAKKYWEFVRGEVKASTKTDDDIPF